MKIKSKKLIIIFLIVAFLVFIYIGFFMPCGHYFRFYDRVREKTLMMTPIEIGDEIFFELEHSLEHIPWHEYYHVNENWEFNLDKIMVPAFGAGIPAEMDVPVHIDENGMIWFEDINSVFDHFQWITSNKYMKVVTINGIKVFDFRDIPDVSRVRGDIITKRGLFHNG